MSQASVRRLRQVKRRVGKRPSPLIVAAIYHNHKFFFHFRSGPVRVVELSDPKNMVKKYIEENYWYDFLERNGLYKQKLIGVEAWFNKKATLEDLVKVGVQKVTLVPREHL